MATTERCEGGAALLTFNQKEVVERWDVASIRGVMMWAHPKTLFGCVAVTITNLIYCYPPLLTVSPQLIIPEKLTGKPVTVTDQAAQSP